MLFYVPSAAACTQRGGVAVAFHPGPQAACVRPNGRVRRIAAAAQCGQREQRLLLPRNVRTYFCAEMSNGGMLRRVGQPTRCAPVRQRAVFVVNHAPTSVSLANAGVAENQPAGALVGRLAGTDPDAGARLTYSLVGGDATAFRITGNALETAGPFDFEAKSGYSLVVRATDQWGLSVERTLAVAVTDVNEAPTDVSVVPASVAENLPSGATVGALAATDPDRGDSLAFSLVPGTSDNGYFRIEGSTLRDEHHARLRGQGLLRRAHPRHRPGRAELPARVDGAGDRRRGGAAGAACAVGAVRLDRRCVADRGEHRYWHGPVHGQPLAGERAAGDGRLRDRGRHRDHVRRRLPGCERDAQLRARRDEQDDRRAGQRRHGDRAERDLHRFIVERGGCVDRGRPGDRHDHERRRQRRARRRRRHLHGHGGRRLDGRGARRARQRHRRRRRPADRAARHRPGRTGRWP